MGAALPFGPLSGDMGEGTLAYNLGNAYINVIPTFKGGGKAIAAEFSGVSNIGARAGKSIGDAMRKSFNASGALDLSGAKKAFEVAQGKLADAAEQSARRQKKAQEDVAKAQQRIADVAEKAGAKAQAAATKVADAEADAAREAARAATEQEAAKRKVEIAQARYNETIKKYAPESSRALAAADQLARAESNLERVTTRSADAQAKAKKRVADAQDQYKKAVKESGGNSDDARRAADQLRAAEQKLEAVTEEAASEHARLSDEVDDAKKSMDKASRSSGGLAKAWDGVKSAGGGFKSLGGKINSYVGPKLWSGIKLGAIGAAGAVAGVFSGAVVKGFSRLSSIEQAEAKLTGLGHSAESVSSIMDNALASVKGTAFGLDEAAGLAGTLVASGIKPGQELEKTLALTADSATIAGRELSDMGLIWGSVAAKGKLQGDDAMQLLESGIPIWQMVGDVMGKTAGEAQELGSKGKVSFDVFRQAMEQGVGGAAQAAGNTTTGAFKNMGAAMGRFGAALLKDVYPLIGPLFNKITSLFDYLTDAAGPAMDAVIAKVTPLAKGFQGVYDILANGNFAGRDMTFGLEEDSPVVGTLFNIRDTAITVFGAVKSAVGSVDWAGVWGTISQTLSPIVDSFKQLGPVAVEAIRGLSPLGNVFKILQPVLPQIGQAIGQLAVTLSGILGGALKAIMPALSSFVSQIGPMFASLMATVVPAVLNIANAVASAAQPIVAAIGPLLQTVIDRVMPIVGVAVDAVKQVVQSVSTFLAPILERVGGIIGGLVTALTPLVSALLGMIGSVLRPLFQIVVQIVQNALNFLAPIFNVILAAAAKLVPVVSWLAGVLAQVANVIGAALGVALQWLADKFTWLSTAVMPAVNAAWAGIQGAMQAVAGWVMSTLVPAFQVAWQGIATAAQWLWTSVIQPVWNGIKTAIVLAIAAVMTYIDAWVAIYRNVLAPVFTWLLNSVIMPVWNGIKAAINGVVSWFQNTAWPIISTVIGWIRQYFENLKTGLGIIWNFIKNNVINPVVSWFQNTVAPLIASVIDGIKNRFDTFKNNLQAIWQFVKNNVINPVVAWFQNTIAPLIGNVIDGIKNRFETFKTNLQTIWNFIRDNVIGPVADWFQNTIKPKIDNVTDGIKSAFDTMKEGVKAAWDGVKEAAKAPVKFVVQTVVNDGLIKNFNSIAGKFGVSEIKPVSLPAGFSSGGYTGAGRKYQPAGIVHADEFVIRKESQRSIERHAPGLLSSLNRSGASALAGSGIPGYAGGGFVGKAWNGIKQAGGDVLDKVMEGFDFVAEAMADPKGAFTKLLNGFGSAVPGAGAFRDIAMSVPAKIADAIAEALIPSGGGGTVPQSGDKSAGFSRAATEASRLGLRMTSGYRAGARTAKSGSVSLHAQGRARDYAGSASAMSAFFDAMDKPPYPTELLYSPKGSRNIHRGGGRYANSGATLRNHYNHVHVGYSAGGWTGPGSKYTPAGVVHADEFVMQKSARRSIEATAPGLLDRMNALGAGALGYASGGLVKGYASGGKVSSSSGKVGKSNVADILKGLLGTPKEVRSAADKLAKEVTSAFKARGSASKKSTINSLSDQLDSLKKKASALTKVSKETVKVTSKINGKTRISKVATADAKAAASELKGVQAQIAKTQDALKKARRGDTSGVAAAKGAAYEAGVLAGRTLKLTAYANTREKLAARIKKATEALDEAVKIRDDYSASMQEKLAGTFGITSDAKDLGIVAITEQFKKSTLAVQSFGGNMAKLRKRGLPSELIDQVAQLGAVDGNAVAGNLLRGTDAQIARLTAWFKGSQNSAASVGSGLANQMYGAGVDGARGLVDGLNSQLKAVNGAAKKVAGSLVNTVKRTLKIHSPSRVFREIGGFTGAGMALGVEDSTAGVQSAMRAMVEPPRVDTSFINSSDASAVQGGKMDLSDEAIDRLADAFAQVKLVMDRRELASAVRSSQALSVRTGARV